MSRPGLLQQFVADMDADLLQYRSLHVLLQEQFTAALRHDSAGLLELNERVLAMVAALDLCRERRSALLAQLLAPQNPATLGALLERLPPATRGVVQTRAQALERLIHDCKERNTRNGRLVTDQQAILQRVLRGKEEDTYAQA